MEDSLIPIDSGIRPALVTVHPHRPIESVEGDTARRGPDNQKAFEVVLTSYSTTFTLLYYGLEINLAARRQPA
jgi:hypothetical protein